MRGNKAILFGNGGSVADAQHIAAELVGRYYLERACQAGTAAGSGSIWFEREGLTGG